MWLYTCNPLSHTPHAGTPIPAPPQLHGNARVAPQATAGSKNTCAAQHTTMARYLVAATTGAAHHGSVASSVVEAAPRLPPSPCATCHSKRRGGRRCRCQCRQQEVTKPVQCAQHGAQSRNNPPVRQDQGPAAAGAVPGAAAGTGRQAPSPSSPPQQPSMPRYARRRAAASASTGGRMLPNLPNARHRAPRTGAPRPRTSCDSSSARCRCWDWQASALTVISHRWKDKRGGRRRWCRCQCRRQEVTKPAQYVRHRAPRTGAVGAATPAPSAAVTGAYE